jgi:Flp pilus assembly protein TadG
MWDKVMKLTKTELSYKSNIGGNVAMMFSFCVAAVIGTIGLAIDYSAATGKEQSLQSIIDAATLAASKSKETEEDALNEIVAAVIAQHNVEGWDVDYTLNIVNDTIQLEASVIYDTQLMGFVGRDQIPLNVKAASPISKRTPVRLSLVLDTTSSMQGANIVAARQAANAMMDDLEGLDSPVAVSLVPFGQYVNVGMSQASASWLDISRNGDVVTDCYDEYITITPQVCTPTGNMITRDVVQDGVVTGTQTYEQQNCTSAVREPTGNEICTDRTYSWAGCVGSRNAPHNERARSAPRIPGILNLSGKSDESCGSELRPLTTDLQSIKASITSLDTAGSTYLPSGIIWGWRTLQDQEPFVTPASVKALVDDDASPVRALVIMTDGGNTLSQGGDGYYAGDERHRKTNEAEANARTAAVCEAAKDDGLMIFTIGYRMGLDREDAKLLLEACASSTSNYFDASNASQLKKAFKDVAGQLDMARLSL